MWNNRRARDKQSFVQNDADNNELSSNGLNQTDLDILLEKIMLSFKQVIENTSAHNAQDLISQILSVLSESQSKAVTQDLCRDDLEKLKAKTKFLDIFNKEFKECGIIEDQRYSIIRPFKAFFKLLKTDQNTVEIQKFFTMLAEDTSSLYATKLGQLGDEEHHARSMVNSGKISINSALAIIEEENKPYIESYLALDTGKKSPIEVKTVKAIKAAMSDVWKNAALKEEIQEYCTSSCIFQKFSSDDELAAVGICGLYHVESQQTY